MKIKINGYLKNLPYRMFILRCNNIVEYKLIYNGYDINLKENESVVLVPIYEEIYPKYIRRTNDLSFTYYLFPTTKFTLVDKHYKLKLKGEINLWQNTQ